ncbi:hypothetical protein L195_g022821 [Trifolium pratense]|uniref:Uncharacterized protein n=2 Tax=Trifolium pratense TaxID=57577 RepID=A0A2K3N931_TRIPR|nr:hypothetical protein L195_g022821 [Trifolium pratense]CAJ2634663.1 unnamed protein product [Trifolium pratense]
MALATESHLPILSFVDLPSLLQAVAVDTLVAAAQSLALIGYLLTNVPSLVSPNLTAMDSRFPLEHLLGKKPAYLENKSDTDDDDEDDDDDDDVQDEDDDGDEEDYSGDEDDEEGDPEDDPEANGAGGSDDGDDEDGDEEDDEEDGDDEEDEEEEEEDEETPQPPTKKRK